MKYKVLLDRIINKNRFGSIIGRNKLSILMHVDSKSRFAKNVASERFSKVVNSFIDDYSYIGKNSVIINAYIGKFTSISRDVRINLGKHPIEYVSTSPVFYSNKNILKTSWVVDNVEEFNEFDEVKIGNDVWIGANSIILGGLTIGDGAIIGAGAVVTKDVPPYSIVVGCPARVIKYRFDEETINRLLAIKWWNWDIEKIKKQATLFKDVNKFIELNYMRDSNE